MGAARLSLGRRSQLLGGVDEEHVVGLLALLEHEDADGDARGVEEVRGQADDGVDMAVLEQLGADAFLSTATEEHAVGQDDRHHAFIFEVVEAVQQEGEIGGGLGGEAVALEMSSRLQGLSPLRSRGTVHVEYSAQLVDVSQSLTLSRCTFERSW